MPSMHSAADQLQSCLLSADYRLCNSIAEALRPFGHAVIIKLTTAHSFSGQTQVFCMRLRGLHRMDSAAALLPSYVLCACIWECSSIIMTLQRPGHAVIIVILTAF